MWIYARSGAAALLLSQTGRFFTPGGSQVGWLEGESVYTTQADQIGWFGGGLLRDQDGNVCGFAPDPADPTHPALPVPIVHSGVLSLPAAARRPSFPDPWVRAVARAEWSRLEPAELFDVPHTISR